MIADDFGIGRVMGDIDNSATSNELLVLAENRIIYMSDRGFDPDKSLYFSFNTLSDAEGKLIVSPVPGHEFDKQEEEVIATLLQMTDMHISRYVAMFQAEESSLKQGMTDLPNSAGFMKVVHRKIANRSISNYDSYYFNLTGFGLISRRYGNREGDAIMVRYANELKNFIKPGEIVGHLGGDNFVALIEKGERSEQFQELISGVIVDAKNADGVYEKVKISSLAGFKRLDENTNNDQVISGPGMALAYAKLHKIPLVELTDEIAELATRIKTVELSFESALANDEFTVFYQPKVNTVSGEIIGAEALARWYENGNLVSPAGFIPYLERAGKISKLDLFVLESVCKDIHDWKGKGRKVVPCSVNFSRKDLKNTDLPSQIMEIIKKYEVNQDEIIIEVTETSSEDEKATMMSFLQKLKDFGIETSIDDFGTGYSSLSALREYPIGEIKIDRSFINKDLNENDEIIIKSVIDMAEKLHIDVITEGVERVSQKEFLHRLGCDKVQGYLYDKALPKNEFAKRLIQGSYPEVKDYKEE
ncbi:MAG: EAL domain-containing protein [Erysipelotrichaceae bacterium]|nr:EAL domain-containing protein [Erysipelotrichaceae bacterium]